VSDDQVDGHRILATSGDDEVGVDLCGTKSNNGVVG
jgi:hypothetical protein